MSPTWYISMQCFTFLFNICSSIKLLLISPGYWSPTLSKLRKLLMVILPGNDEATLCLHVCLIGQDSTPRIGFSQWKMLAKFLVIDWSGTAFSRMSWATGQRGDHDSSSSHPGHPEAQSMPHGAVPLLPAMLVHEPEEFQGRHHEVTWPHAAFLVQFYRFLIYRTSPKDTGESGIK